MRVVVVGAGVMGLSCAVRLREAGYDAHVLARDLPLETTSAVAAALWYPYLVFPPERAVAWARRTYECLAQIAAEFPESGVRMRLGTELLRKRAGEPWWRAALPRTTTLQGLEDVPAGYAAGWRLAAPVADTSRYLPWLVGRLESSGGTLTRAWLAALPPRGIVVNCTGLAAAELVNDARVHPVRGQVVYLEQIGLDTWWLDQADEQQLTYIIPREREIVVGGTAEPDVFDRRPNRETTRTLVERASSLVPELRRAERLGERVGLRPARPSVRLETEHREQSVVVHCYGHGGAGVTLSWGCADDVLGEVERLTG